MKQLLLDITRFFAGYCPMSDANIQACHVVPKAVLEREQEQQSLN